MLGRIGIEISSLNSAAFFFTHSHYYCRNKASTEQGSIRVTIHVLRFWFVPKQMNSLLTRSYLTPGVNHCLESQVGFSVLYTAGRSTGH